jgi:hypothetical protein
VFCSTKNGTSGTNGTELIINKLTFYFYYSISSFTLGKPYKYLYIKYLCFLMFCSTFGKNGTKMGIEKAGKKRLFSPFFAPGSPFSGCNLPQ